MQCIEKESKLRTMGGSLERLPEEYWNSRDPGTFMHNIYRFMQNYIRKRLTSDPDLAGDFTLHFYERIDACMECYRHHSALPFAGFLASYLKHEFLNFQRCRKVRTLDETPVTEFFGILEAGGYPREQEKPQTEEQLLVILHELPEESRLPVKLYYGFDLSLDEIRYIIGIIPDTLDASQFFIEYERRRNEFISKRKSLEERAARLNLMIHAAQTHPQALSRKRMKRSVEARLERTGQIYSIQELSNLFGTGRSTIFRRIRQAQRALQSAVRSFHPQGAGR